MSWNRACVYVDKRLGIEVVSSWSLQTLQLFRYDEQRHVVCADEDVSLSSNCSYLV